MQYTLSSIEVSSVKSSSSNCLSYVLQLSWVSTSMLGAYLFALVGSSNIGSLLSWSGEVGMVNQHGQWLLGTCYNWH